MLQVRKNEISLRQWSGGGTAHLWTLEGTRAGARWLGAPPSLEVGAPNLQYIAFNTYSHKQKPNLF